MNRPSSFIAGDFTVGGALALSGAITGGTAAIHSSSGAIAAGERHSRWSGANLTATFPALTSASDGDRRTVTNLHDTYLTVAAGSGDALHAMAHSLVAPGETIEYQFEADVWYMVSTPRFDPRREFEFYEEFLSNTNAGHTNWTATVSGTGAAINSNTSASAGHAGHPGSFQLTTGTDTTGAASLTRGNNLGSNVILGGGRLMFDWVFNIGTLSTVGEEYIIRIGSGDTAGADQVDGVYFIYDRLTSVNWIMATANNSTRTATASSVAVGTGWTRLTGIANAAATSIEYFANNVSLGTVSTNIPTATTRATGLVASIVKSAGSTARAFDVDLCYVRQLFTTAR